MKRGRFRGYPAPMSPRSVLFSALLVLASAPPPTASDPGAPAGGVAAMGAPGLLSRLQGQAPICNDCLTVELDDPVDHPKHYTSHPSGVECIDVTEHMGFCLGNAIKYIWRADLKGGIEDLRKAQWYIQREISRLECEEVRKG